MTQSQKRARILSALDYYERTLRKRADGDRSEGTVKRVRAELAKAIDEAFATPVQVAPQPSAMTTCNCRWDGEIRVQQCELHQAWHDTLFERADQVRGLQAKLAATASVAPQDDARDAADARRMNWLETMAVNVRVPLRCGSRDLFWSIADDEDGFVRPGDIRSKIDAAMRRSGPAAKPTKPTQGEQSHD